MKDRASVACMNACVSMIAAVNEGGGPKSLTMRSLGRC